MLLVIDSATAACSVALIKGGEVIDARHEVVGRGHAEKLLPMIEDMLGTRRPGAILVDCGPGSFTGVRVGLAAAQGLAIGWGIPVHGYSSTALIAAGVQGNEIAVALIGGHGQIFVQSYRRDPLEPTGPLRSLAPEDAAAAISTHDVHGSGAAMLVTARGFGTAWDALPSASEAWRLPEALRTLPPRPIYGRAPDAKPMT
jgi:tRNA threonylcarbamoyl adenosine modification protein YeaZ